METNDSRFNQAWNQKYIPIVLRRNEKGQRLRVRLPYDASNRLWLQNGRTTSIRWINSEKCWELPKSWFNDFVDRALEKYGQVYVIQPYREQEVCATACMNAKGHECTCSCMGANHGAGNDGSWFEVGDTFATRWGGMEIACRLMSAKKPTQD